MRSTFSLKNNYRSRDCDKTFEAKGFIENDSVSETSSDCIWG